VGRFGSKPRWRTLAWQYRRATNLARRLRTDRVESERSRPSASPSASPPRQWLFEEESSVAQCYDDLSFVDQMELASQGRG
jgi:hypothetical protein